MNHKKLCCPPIVYIQGEEMSNYVMKIFLDKCIFPHIDTKNSLFLLAYFIEIFLFNIMSIFG